MPQRFHVAPWDSFRLLENLLAPTCCNKALIAAIAALLWCLAYLESSLAVLDILVLQVA